MSHKGHDDSKCGVNHRPCRTLSYTLEKRAKDDDVIQINGQDGVPYPIKKQHPVFSNITLIGIEGSARIAGEFPVAGSYLFADVVRGSHKSLEQVSINLVNLKLIRIGIIKLKYTLVTLNVQVLSCTVSKLSKSSIVDSSAAKTTVIFKKSIIRQVSKGLQVKSREFRLNMESSKIANSGGSYPQGECPQFIVTDKFESLVAHFRKSSFKYTSLIDLGASHQNKLKISIIDSIFDDDGKNFKNNGCFSGITLRNTNALIVNSNFTNIISKKSLIKVINSFVTFKECIFSNISSSSIIASLNKLNGFNHGSVYLQSTEGNFRDCIFHKNSVNGQYGSGGAMYISNSDITVQQCLFKENRATCRGGAVNMINTQGSFVNCTFERNSVKSLPQRRTFGGAICALDNSQLTIHQCIFKENTATDSGGATYIQKSRSLLLKNCTFERNMAIGSTDKRGTGGAIASFDNSDMTVQRCLFKENTATYGGGAVNMIKTRGSFINCVFEGNSAKIRPQTGETFGGAICAQDNSHLTIRQCIFKKNTATYGGGATYIHKTQSLFENCTFERNTVKSLQQSVGGAIGAKGAGTNITIKQWLLRKNKAFSIDEAKASGGAIASWDNPDMTVQQCFFKENTATYSGGAIHSKRTRGSIGNCIFEGNTVQNLQGKTFGGAISSEYGSSYLMKQCLFKENNAAINGGAYYMESSESSFENCTFEGKV